MSTDDARTKEMPAADETRTDTAIIGAAQTEVTPAAEDHDQTLANIPAVAAGPEPVAETRPDPVPGTTALAIPWPFWDSMDRKERAEGILPCVRCAAEFASEHAAAWPHMHDVLRYEAGAAGWGFAGDGDWCCPPCRAKGGDGERWPTIEADTEPGSEIYDERLNLHVAAMKEIGADLRAAAPGIHEHAETGLHAITLHITDMADRLGLRDRIGVSA